MQHQREGVWGVREKELDERELDVRGDDREGVVIESGIRVVKR